MKYVKKYFKPALYVVAVIVVGLQFYRPPMNRLTAATGKEIAATFNVPSDVDQVLRRSCYDCHSNNTVYPWYANVQPVGWWLNGHIVDGKKEVNFDEYSGYRSFRKFRKFHDIDEQLSTDKMPLPSYLFMHGYAILSPDEKTLLISWAHAMQDTMRAHFPPDSLERRRPQPR